MPGNAAHAGTSLVSIQNPNVSETEMIGLTLAIALAYNSRTKATRSTSGIGFQSRAWSRTKPSRR